jgi:hypothetical protein
MCRLALKESQKYGSIRPEFRLLMGQVGGILIPIGLFWIAFTTYTSLDCSHRWFNSFWNGSLLRLFIDIHIPRHCLSAHRRFGARKQQFRAE